MRRTISIAFDDGLAGGFFALFAPARLICDYTANMPLSDHLTIALKEWHAVCRALASGRQTILLRKGGIYESSGEFVLQREHALSEIAMTASCGCWITW